jgi:hypothetical protein
VEGCGVKRETVEGQYYPIVITVGPYYSQAFSRQESLKEHLLLLPHQRGLLRAMAPDSPNPPLPLPLPFVVALDVLAGSVAFVLLKVLRFGDRSLSRRANLDRISNVPHSGSCHTCFPTVLRDQAVLDRRSFTWPIRDGTDIRAKIAR